MSRARPSTARPTHTLSDTAEEHAATAAAPSASARRPASAAVHRPAPPAAAAPVASALFRRSAYSPAVADSDSEEDSFPARGRSSLASARPMSSRSVRSGGSSSSRPLSAHLAPEISSVVDELRASSGTRYTEFMPPPSPFTVSTSTPATAQAAAAVRGLYRIVDGQRVLRPSRPQSSLPGDASAAAALPPAHPPVPPIPAFASAHATSSINTTARQTSAAAAALAASSSLPPQHYNRPSMSHNFTDGSLKAAPATAAPVEDEDLGVDLFGVPILRKPKMRFGEHGEEHDSELTFEERRAKARAAEAAKAEAQQRKDAEAAAIAASRRHAECSASPSFAAPQSSRDGSRSARSSRPPSHRSHGRPSSGAASARPTYPGVHDPSSRERDALWTKGRADASEAKARQEAELSQTRALDQALQITVAPKALHEPSAANHALLGMRLVSEDGFAELENARAESEEEGPLPEGALEKLHHASLHPEAGLSEDDEIDSDDDHQQLRSSRAAQREMEEESNAADASAAAARTHANLADASRIDFHRVGLEVAKRLQQQGHPLSASHLDILHSLPLLERVWLACHSTRAHAGGVRGGLTESQFVDFLSHASEINPPTLAVLFAKMDVHSLGELRWDSYLSYLVREMSHKWSMNAGAGTYVVKQDMRTPGALRSETATTIKQLLILPAQGSALLPSTSSKIIARVGNHTIQVFDTLSLRYLYHLPLHMQAKQRRPNNKTWGEEEREMEERQKRKAVTEAAAAASAAETSAAPATKGVHRSSEPAAVPLYSAQTGHRSNVNPAVLERLAANDWVTDGRAEVRSIHAEAAGREQQRQETEDAAAAAAEGNPARRSSIRRIGKSSTPRPMSARPASAASNSGSTDAPASRPTTAARTPRPPSAAVKSNYQRKLDNYLQAIEFVSAVPIAQPLACAGQRQDTGRPPVAERATSGGYLHRQAVELEKRNEPYAFPLTAIASFPALKQIAVAAQDRSIRSFGLVRRHFELQGLFYVHDTPRCLLVDTLTPLDFNGMHGLPDRSLAIVGGLNGSISAYSPSTHARLYNLAHVHAEQSVQKLALFPHVGLISAGMDGRLAVVDPTTFVVTRYLGEGLRSDSMDPESRVSNLHAQASKGHSSGVFSFACAFGSRSLLSVGFDREVFSWDPRLSAPTWKLPTQGSDLLDVLVNEAKNQCIVVCRDSKIRVYDSRTFKLVQETMDAAAAGAAGAAAGTTTACAFDEQRTEMITATDHITRWVCEPSIKNKAALSSGPPATVIAAAAASGGDPEKAFVRQTQLVALHASQKAHISSIVAVLYSPTFRQVVTVCSNESIRVWSLFSGCRGPVFEFNSTHRAQLTAATLDANGKRLLTACHHGRVLLWNHNNGELLWQFATLDGLSSTATDTNVFPRMEVNRLALLTTASQCLVGSGWSKNLFRWAAPLAVSASSSTVATARPSEAPGHQSQILSLAAFGNFVVTGDARGELISWAADSGHRLQSLMLPASSQELKVHRDARKGGDPDAMRGPIQRAACSPAVTSLAFFLLHDVEGFDRWHAQSNAGGAADYRAQALHTHRACLFVGTDDGSVHLVAPQGLTLLYSALHLLPDTISAVAVVQTIREEEIAIERPAAAAASRRSSVRRASTLEDDAAAAAAAAASNAASLAKQLHHRTESLQQAGSAALMPVAKFHNPFANQRKIQFSAPPAQKTEVEASPAATAVSEQQLADDELAAAVAEMAGLEEFQSQRLPKQPPPNPLLSSPTARLRVPFTTRSEFKASVLPASDAAWIVAESEANATEPEAHSLEEYLARREAKKQKSLTEAKKQNQLQQGREETKEQQGSGTDTFMTEPALEASSVAVAPKLQLQLVAESRPAAVQVRRVLETRMLVADSMAGNDAALYSIALVPSLRASTNEAHRSTISASLVDFDFEVAHLKSIFLYAPPHAHAPTLGTVAEGEQQPEPLLRPTADDATTDLSVVQQPGLQCTVFLAASSEGRACLWTPDGDWIAEFGQAAAKGWPLSVPAGSALRHVHEAAVASPTWGGSRADAAAAAGAKAKAFSFEAEDGSQEAEGSRVVTPPPHDADSDRWSSDGSGDALDSEEESEFLRLQVASLGFAADDSSITAMLASVRKRKIMNDDGKKGMAMGPAFAAQEAKRRAEQKAAEAAEVAAAPAALATTRTRPSTPRSQAREERRRARLARLLEGLKERYASSFALLHARPRALDSSQAILPASADAATVVGHSAAYFSSKAFSEAHPQYVPETLRPGGLRSALFLNDAKLRMGKTHEQVREALAQREALRAKEEQRRIAEAAALGIDLGPVAPAENYLDDYSFRAGMGAADLNFFQLAPREQRAAAIEQAERDKAVHALTRFLADRSNIVDPASGLVRNHGVARLSVLFETQEAEAARRFDRQQKMARPAHVRAASRAVRIAAKKKTNVWLRLAGTPEEGAATTTAAAAAGSATGRLTPRRPGTASSARSAGSAASSRPHSARPAQPFSLLVHPAYIAMRDQQSKTQVLLPHHANAALEQHVLQQKRAQILMDTARSH